MVKRKTRWSKVVLVLLLLAGLLLSLLYVGAKRYFPLRYRPLIAELSEETGVSESLIYAVIHTESRFRPEVESHLGARGLMQLTEETFEWVKYRKQDHLTSYEDLFLPDINIEYGIWLLSLLEQEFGSQTTVLSAYHAGWGNVSRWLKNIDYSSDGRTIENIPFRDTAHYVHKVERAQKIYQLLYQVS